MDNAFSCSTAANLVFVPTNADFSAVQDTPCSSFGIGDATLEYPVDGASSYPATITFDPLNPGAQTTTLTVSDTTNGGVGSATVSSFAETTPQTVTFTAPTTTTYTYAAPPSPVTITLTVANGGRRRLEHRRWNLLQRPHYDDRRRDWRRHIGRVHGDAGRHD